MEDGVRGVMTTATDRTVLLVAGVWFALWSLVPLVSVLSGGEGYPLLPVALGTAAVGGTAVATAAGLAGSGRALVAVMAAQAALLLALTSPAALPIGSNGYTATVACTSVSLAAGMLLPRRPAQVVVVAVTAAAVLVWSLTLTDADQLAASWYEVPLLAAYTLADGMAALTVVGALRAAARRGDRAAAGLAAAAESAERDDAVRSGLAAAARALHETAVNTLGAIARGQVGGDPARLRDRARFDGEVLARLRRGTAVAVPSPWVQPGWWEQRAAALGLAVSMSDRAAQVRLPSADDGAGQAALALAHEALINAARHGGRSVEVDAARHGDRIDLVLTDDGPGFDPAVTPRSGVWRYLAAEAALRGVDLRVESAVGSGTAVAVSWTPAPPSAATPDAALPDAALADAASTDAAADHATATFDATMAAVAVRFVAWLSLPIAVSLVGALLLGAGPALVVMVLLYVGVVGATLGAARRTGRVVVGLRLALVALAPALVLLQGSALLSCGDASLVGWAALGALVALALVAWFGRPWEVGAGAVLTVVAAVWMAGGFDDEVCAAGTLVDLVTDLLVVAALVGLRAAVGRFARRAAEAEALAADARAVEQRREAASVVVASALDGLLDQSASFLAEVADDAIDVHDPAVRGAAGELESALRQVIGLGTRLEEFAPAVLRVLGRARERGVDVDLRVGATPGAPPGDLAARIETTLGDLIDHTATGETVTIGIFALGDRTALTATFPPLTPRPADTSSPPGPAPDRMAPGPEDLLEVVDLGEQHVLEATWGRR